MFVLVLNDMRSSHIETPFSVCLGETREEILDLIKRETVEVYKDGKWGKTFRKGGPLEWYNRGWSEDFSPDDFGHGIGEAQFPPRAKDL